MTAPVATARGTPDGIPLQDGFASKVTIGGDSTIELWEDSVTPPGYDGGDPIDFSSHHNTLHRTKAPPTLIDMTPMTFEAKYDPDVYDELLTIINVADTITVTWNDGTTLAFYGYLRSAIPGPNVAGEAPKMTCTVEPTNWDPTNDVEAGPTLTEVAGT